jgi:hypothetical protein
VLPFVQTHDATFALPSLTAIPFFHSPRLVANLVAIDSIELRC